MEPASTARRRRRSYVAVGGAALFALLVVTAGYWIAREKILPREYVSEAAVRAEINAALPRGSTQAQIVAFLNENNWSPDGPRTVSGGWDFGTPNGRISGDTPVIAGTIPHAGSDWLCDYDLGLYFILDAQYQLDRVILQTINCAAP
jgi:hypothetical protein